MTLADRYERNRVAGEAAVKGGRLAQSIERPLPEHATPDAEVENAVREYVSAYYPNDGFVGEELGSVRSGSDHVWLVDPIDGTDSYLHGSPLWATSIGFRHQGDVVIGAVFAPDLNQLVQSAPNEGLYLNGHRVARSGPDRRLDFGWIGRGAEELRLAVSSLASRTRYSVRFDVPAALGLAEVAVGASAGYLDDQVAIWDVAAGLALLRESPLRPKCEYDLASGSTKDTVIAASPSAWALMIEAQQLLTRAGH